MLTTIQKKRLAKEARKLAMECVAGRAPFYNASYSSCAIGEVAFRAGLTDTAESHDPTAEIIASRAEYEAFGVRFSDDTNALVSQGLRHANPEGAVFPLLAFADALEESARK